MKVRRPVNNRLGQCLMTLNYDEADADTDSKAPMRMDALSWNSTCNHGFELPVTVSYFSNSVTKIHHIERRCSQ